MANFFTFDKGESGEPVHKELPEGRYMTVISAVKMYKKKNKPGHGYIIEHRILGGEFENRTVPAFLACDDAGEITEGWSIKGMSRLLEALRLQNAKIQNTVDGFQALVGKKVGVQLVDSEYNGKTTAGLAYFENRLFPAPEELSPKETENLEDDSDPF